MSVTTTRKCDVCFQEVPVGFPLLTKSSSETDSWQQCGPCSEAANNRAGALIRSFAPGHEKEVREMLATKRRMDGLDNGFVGETVANKADLEEIRRSVKHWDKWKRKPSKK